MNYYNRNKDFTYRVQDAIIILGGLLLLFLVIEGPVATFLKAINIL